MEITIAAGSLAVAVIALIFSWHSTKTASEAVKQTFLLKLFSSFDEANRATINDPDLLYSVHGLDRSISEQEASRIAYLSLLIDGFQHFYGQVYNEDFPKMENELKARSTFLNKILTVKENQDRWKILKELYYGDFDRNFIRAIDAIIEHENQKLDRTPSGQRSDLVSTNQTSKSNKV